MTKDLAQTFLYELFNVADHVDNCTQSARCALDGDDIDHALEMLAACSRSAISWPCATGTR